MVSKEELYVKKIESGTVIDHIAAGHALDVLNILRIDGKGGQVVSAVMNVASKKHRRKDIVKVEGRELKAEEVDKIALISPTATINIIRDYEVVEKKRVELPKVIRGIIKCDNPSCVTNAGEPIEPTFHVNSAEPLKVRCHYCGNILNKAAISKQF